MNIQISLRGLGLAKCAAPLMMWTIACAQSPHVGTWETKELLIKEAAVGCRYLEAVTATFQLAAGINNAVNGSLTRRFERMWWTANPGCVLPGVNTSPGFTLRQDSWIVSGEPNGRDTQRLKGVYAGCTTDCKEPWTPPNSFEIEFVRKVDGMSGGLLNGIVGTTMFRDTFQTQVDSSNASESFMKLLQPLLDGSCEAFLLQSVDAGSRQRFPRDLTCAFGTQLKQLLPTIVRHERSQAHSPTLAQLVGMGGPLLLSEGDVLVQRFVVVNTAGNGVHLSGVLRKQADGSWKLRDIVP